MALADWTVEYKLTPHPAVVFGLDTRGRQAIRRDGDGSPVMQINPYTGKPIDATGVRTMLLELKLTRLSDNLVIENADLFTEPTKAAIDKYINDVVAQVEKVAAVTPVTAFTAYDATLPTPTEPSDLQKAQNAFSLADQSLAHTTALLAELAKSPDDTTKEQQDLEAVRAKREAERNAAMKALAAEVSKADAAAGVIADIGVGG